VWAALLPVLYSVFSAIIGTQSVLFSKTLAVLLRATFNGDNQVRGVGVWGACGEGGDGRPTLGSRERW
jgi:hypothetical protein